MNYEFFVEVKILPRIYNADGTFEEVEHINAYLLAGPDIYVTSRTIPICPVPKMTKGSQPTDDGNLILSEEEKNYFVKKYPNDKKFVRQLLGAEEFIHNKKRYCLWLVDATPDEIKHNKFIYERVKAVKEFRLKSKKLATQKSADTPHLFQEIRQPNSNYILVPSVSGDRRNYIPMGFVSPDIISTNLNLMIPDAQIWHFGILTSRVHMAWTKVVCGRLGTSYRYSAKIVYNNFVWVKMEFCDYMDLQLAAEKILDVRKKYPNASLADLYDEITMPKDLRAAHREVDKIVMKIYRLDEDMTDEDIAVRMLYHYEFVTNYLKEHGLKQLRRINSDDEEFDDEE